jgi:hypothetical protein
VALAREIDLRDGVNRLLLVAATALGMPARGDK